MSNQILEHDLQALQDQLVRGLALVEQNFARAVQALQTRDDSLARLVEEEDSKIDEMEVAIDQAVLSVLYRQRPVAHDLRKAFTAAKISTDLERIGDSAVSLVRASRKLTALPELSVSTSIPMMGQIGADMLREVGRALSQPDAEKLRQVIARDKELDGLHRALIEEVTQKTIGDGSLAAQAVQWVIIARNLERVGDHAKNIAEELIFLAQAVDVRHTQEGANRPG